LQISIAVQCLSTDFSNQKGVKGLPLHIQIDTYDENDSSEVPFHRGYCQIKVFCDKGAERKLRDEDKRAQKRKLAENEKKIKDGFLNPVPQFQVSTKRAVLVRHRCRCRFPVQGANRKMLHETRRDEKRRLQGRKKSEGEYHEPCERSEFYHMSDLTKRAALFIGPDEYDSRYLDASLTFDPLSELEPIAKRPRPSERVMLYAKKRDERFFTALHLVPPSLSGLLEALNKTYGVEREKVTGLYKQCLKGVTVKLDDDMIKHYCNEDTFIIEIEQASDDPSCCTVTLVETLVESPPSQFSAP
uniref:CP2 domain-containing protein n=1 Tax=Enterobius vermicularis TaxID=51028 RepID=A0A0N4VNW5_ENTVE